MSFKAYSTEPRRTACRSPANCSRCAATSICAARRTPVPNHTAPMGLPADAPSGPAMPVVESAMSTPSHAQRARRHFAHDRFAHGTMLEQRTLQNAQVARLCRIRVSHVAALKPLRAPGDVGQRLRDESSSAGFGADQAPLASQQELPDLGGKREEMCIQAHWRKAIAARVRSVKTSMTPAACEGIAAYYVF